MSLTAIPITRQPVTQDSPQPAIMTIRAGGIALVEPSALSDYLILSSTADAQPLTPDVPQSAVSSRAAKKEPVDLPAEPTEEQEIQSLTDLDWEVLLSQIEARTCTPFIGAGASQGQIGLGADLARQWAQRYSYPFDDAHDLIRVAQYIAVLHKTSLYPKQQLLSLLEAPPPDFTDETEPHSLLAELELPLYLTTNYDDFMLQALKHHHKAPLREFCHWNPLADDLPDALFHTKPTAENPVVYHLHGYLDRDRQDALRSIVLTEDDYLDFLVNASRTDRRLIPPVVQAALAGNSLLFVGYRLADWSFRVLFQGLIETVNSNQRQLSITVQLPPGEGALAAKQRDYLTQYFGRQKIYVYWGSARKFTAELRRRWNEYQRRRSPAS